ncbi:MAG TPA: polysaccharide deacetylase family protein [Granulicella sp.]
MNRLLYLSLFSVLAIAGLRAHAQTSPLTVALTFDDLPAHGPKPTDETRLQIAQSILTTLQQERLPPVFGFVNGIRVQEAPETMDVLRAWRAAGEPLGSHTFAHSDLDAETAVAFEADIAKNEPLMQQIAAGTDWRWLRYPFLHEGDTLAKRQEVQHYLKLHGYKVAEVSLDFEDYLWNAPYARCVAKHDDAAITWLQRSYLATADQYITVFHETSYRLYGRDIPYVLLLHIGAFDAEMLPDLIALLRSRGFTFTTLQQAQSDPVYSVDPAIGYKGGGTLQELVAAARNIRMPPNSKPYKELDAICR